MNKVELQERGISWIPRNLNEAINYLAEDTNLAKSIGSSIWEEFKIETNVYSEMY
ncbi:hypothetical protein [Brevibacillus sp. SIMBA_040]|uniref:hypothetical protein n=1 Tax=unclassified Brevibacillus TaxID=2684853 RepID=UPI00397988A2